MLVKGDKVLKGDVQAQFGEVQFNGSLTAATSTAVGGVIKVQNDTGDDLIITNMLVDITTKSTGAATLDIGVDDGGDVSSDNLIDGMNAETVKVHSNLVLPGTNGGMAVWKSGEYVVATASATVAGLVGTYKILAMPR